MQPIVWICRKFSHDMNQFFPDSAWLSIQVQTPSLPKAASAQKLNLDHVLLPRSTSSIGSLAQLSPQPRKPAQPDKEISCKPKH